MHGLRRGVTRTEVPIARAVCETYYAGEPLGAAVALPTMCRSGVSDNHAKPERQRVRHRRFSWHKG